MGELAATKKTKGWLLATIINLGEKATLTNSLRETSKCQSQELTDVRINQQYYCLLGISFHFRKLKTVHRALAGVIRVVWQFGITEQFPVV